MIPSLNSYGGMFGGNPPQRTPGFNPPGSGLGNTGAPIARPVGTPASPVQGFNPQPIGAQPMPVGGPSQPISEWPSPAPIQVMPPIAPVGTPAMPTGFNPQLQPIPAAGQANPNAYAQLGSRPQLTY